MWAISLVANDGSGDLLARWAGIAASLTRSTTLLTCALWLVGSAGSVCCSKPVGCGEAVFRIGASFAVAGYGYVGRLPRDRERIH